MDNSKRGVDSRTRLLNKIPKVILLVIKSEGTLSINQLSKKTNSSSLTVKKALEIYDLFQGGPEIHIAHDLQVANRITAIFIDKPKAFIKKLERFVK